MTLYSHEKLTRVFSTGHFARASDPLCSVRGGKISKTELSSMEDSDEGHDYSYDDSEYGAEYLSDDDFALHAEVDTPQRRVSFSREPARGLTW